MPAGGETRAREFYSGVLGLTEVDKPAELTGRGGAWFRGQGVDVHLGVDPAFVSAKKAHPAFVVDDLGRAIDWLRQRGVAVAEPELLQGRQRTYLHDPFGNRIELVDDPGT